MFEKCIHFTFIYIYIFYLVPLEFLEHGYMISSSLHHTWPSQCESGESATGLYIEIYGESSTVLG